jgi:hypothetical protein
MSRPITRATTAIAGIVAATLALSSCGGAKETYDFTQINGVEPASSFMVELPKELLEVAGPAGENLLVESFTISSKELKGASLCAVDVDIEFAKDGADTLLATDPDTPGPAFMAELLGQNDGLTMDDFDKDAPEEAAYFSEDYEEAVVVLACSPDTFDEDADGELWFPYVDEEGDIDSLAGLQFSVMRSGDIGIVQNEVEGFQVDANGDWITD